MSRGGVLQRRRQAADQRRHDRAARVLGLVERFVYDIGLLIAGQDPDLGGYLAAEQVQQLNDAVRPARTAGGRLQPDFGDYAQVRIEGEILDDAAPLRVEVDFEDHSVQYDMAGAPRVRHHRRVRVIAVLDPGVTRIVRHHIAFV